jgi:heme A synthase
MLVLSFEIFVLVGMWAENPDHQERFAAFDTAARRKLGLLSGLALGWLAVTMWIGGYMAESGASTACEGWPLCNGGVAPGADDQEITHMVHRYLAGALIFFVVPVIVVAWRERHQLPWAAAVAIGLGAFYSAQVMVGAFNVWYTFPDPLTVSHTVLASFVWTTLVTTAILGYYQLVPARRSRPLRQAEASA